MHANTAVAGAMKGATKAMASMNKVKQTLFLICSIICCSALKIFLLDLYLYCVSQPEPSINYDI